MGLKKLAVISVGVIVLGAVDLLLKARSSKKPKDILEPTQQETTEKKPENPK